MSKDNKDLIPERTFHVSVGPGDIRTFHGLNSNVQNTVPPEFYKNAEKKGIKLIPRSDMEKVKEEIEEEKRPEDDKVHSKEELQKEKKGDLTDIMLSRGAMRRDIERKKSGLIKQILESNPKQEEPKEEKPE